MTTDSKVAVVAQDSISQGESIVPKPPIKMFSRIICLLDFEFPAMFITTPVNVVNTQELQMLFVATGTFATIEANNLSLEPKPRFVSNFNVVFSIAMPILPSQFQLVCLFVRGHIINIVTRLLIARPALKIVILLLWLTALRTQAQSLMFNSQPITTQCAFSNHHINIVSQRR